MKSYKRWATAGAAFSMVGILAGCRHASAVPIKVSSNLPPWMLISSNSFRAKRR